MYHPFVEAAAMTLVDILVAIVTFVVYCIMLYFLARLQASVGQFL